MDDRIFWLAVYRAVMALAAAIKRYKIDPPYVRDAPVAIDADKVT